MIQINLLPEELRRVGSVPPKTLALLGAASVLGFGSLCTLAFLFFNVRADAANRVEIAQEQLDNLSPQAMYADALEKEKADFERRSDTIQQIASSRILWTRKLDRLSAIVNQDLSTGRHQAWLDQVDITSGRAGRAGSIKLKGFSATANIENVSNFHEDLSTDSVFAEGVESFTAPNSKRGEMEEELDPSQKMEFSFEVKLPEN